jgi:hypothetical protein
MAVLEEQEELTLDDRSLRRRLLGWAPHRSRR